MRYLHKLTGTVAATMALLLAGGVLLAKPAPKIKKDPATPQTQPAKTVEAQVAKPAPAPAAPQARPANCPATRPANCPATRPANCPPCCRDCPLNQASAAPAAKVAEPSAATPAPGPRWQQGGGRGGRGGNGGGGGPPWMRQNPDSAAITPQAAGDPKSDGRSPMEVFHNLLNQHDKIRRTVQEIPGGVFTVTTSTDPAIAYDIKAHVWQMKSRIENHQPLRRWDPLFDELFRHADKIVMAIEETKDGAKVTETSDDPQVAKLIRQHAIRGVSEFVKDGFDRAHKASPLPEGYATPGQNKPADPKVAAPSDDRPRWGRRGN